MSKQGVSYDGEVPGGWRGTWVQGGGRGGWGSGGTAARSAAYLLHDGRFFAATPQVASDGREVPVFLIEIAKTPCYFFVVSAQFCRHFDHEEIARCFRSLDWSSCVGCGATAARSAAALLHDGRFLLQGRKSRRMAVKSRYFRSKSQKHRAISSWSLGPFLTVFDHEEIARRFRSLDCSSVPAMWRRFWDRCHWGPRPQAGEACHGCWEESPLPGMRPTGRWDGSRLMGEKGPLGAVPGPEPSLCDASPGASPPRAWSPPGARSPHARGATAMAPPACSRSRTMRSGPRPRGRARCGMGPTAGDAAHWVQSHMTGHPEGLFPVAGPPGFAVARSPSLVPVPLRDVPSWDPRQCEASTRGNGATATRLAWGGCERRQCHVGVPAVRSPARRRKK